jgi:hypothetical protein
MFIAMINDHPTMDFATKLYNLQLHLDEPAKSKVGPQPYTQAGYLAALGMLDGRYGNDEANLQEAIRAYGALKAVTHTTSARDFIDSIRCYNVAVTTLRGNYNQSSILTTLTDKLSIQWRRRLLEWKEKRVPPLADWNVDEFLRVFDQAVAREEEVERPAQHLTTTGEVTTPVHGSGDSSRQGNNNYNRRSNQHRRSSNQYNPPAPSFNSYPAMVSAKYDCYSASSKSNNFNSVKGHNKSSYRKGRSGPKADGGRGPPPSPCYFCEGNHWSSACQTFQFRIAWRSCVATVSQEKTTRK